MGCKAGVTPPKSSCKLGFTLTMWDVKEEEEEEKKGGEKVLP